MNVQHRWTRKKSPDGYEQCRAGYRPPIVVGDSPPYEFYAKFPNFYDAINIQRSKIVCGYKKLRVTMILRDAECIHKFLKSTASAGRPTRGKGMPTPYIYAEKKS